MKLTFTLIAIIFTLWSMAQSQYKPEDTEVWEPEPRVVTPGASDRLPPSDALVLFDGNDLNQWVVPKNTNWQVKDGVVAIDPELGKNVKISTKRSFGDMQLHIEWRSPEEIDGEGQRRGNSGVFFMGKYEVQILDSYNNKTYVNGQAASVYKESPPLVNANRKPGEWQTYDIIFHAPRFEEGGRLLKPAFVTVLHNGVLVQDHTEIKGTTKYIGPHTYEYHEAELPLFLQDHGDAVSFRNIWVREL